MIILRTEPISVLWSVLLSLAAIVVMFAAKVFVQNRALEKTLSGKPFVLLTGPNNPTKRKIMEAVSEGRTKTIAAPFFGVARVSDMVIGSREFRLVCFQHISDHSPKKDALRLRGRRPDLIMFSLQMTPDMEKIEDQWGAFMKAKKLFPESAAIAIMDSYEKTGKITRETLKLLFEDGLFENPISDRWSMKQLKAFLEKTVAGSGCGQTNTAGISE